MQDSPTNAVLLEKIVSLKEIMLANQVATTTAHGNILVQVTKTNGRVTSLEKTKYMVIGGLVLFNAIILPVLVALILKFLN